MCSLKHFVWWPDRVFAHHCSCVLCGLQCSSGWKLSILLHCNAEAKTNQIQLLWFDARACHHGVRRTCFHGHSSSLTSDKVHRWDLCNSLNRLMHSPIDISILCRCCIDLLETMTATPTAPRSSCKSWESCKLLTSVENGNGKTQNHCGVCGENGHTLEMMFIHGIGGKITRGKSMQVKMDDYRELTNNILVRFYYYFSMRWEDLRSELMKCVKYDNFASHQLCLCSIHFNCMDFRIFHRNGVGYNESESWETMVFIEMPTKENVIWIFFIVFFFFK